MLVKSGVRFRCGLAIRLLALVWLLFAAPAAASSLDAFLPQVSPDALIPGGERFGTVQQDPPVVPVLADGQRLGYVLLNTDYSRAIGYSSKPIDILIGIDNEGVVRGAKLVEHHEPIVLIGIPEQRIRDFLDQFIGFDATRGAEMEAAVDAVSGATVTVLVMEDSLLWAANRVARRLGLGDLEVQRDEKSAPQRTVDTAQQATSKPWEALVDEGSVGSLQLTLADVNAAFRELDNPKAKNRPQKGPLDARFIDLYTGLVSVPTIGRSILGENEWDNLRERLETGEHAIFVAGLGRYSFKGSGYVRGGIFDRIELMHANGTLRFHDYQHTRLASVAANGAPDFDEVAVFTIPADANFEPAKPWELDLLVQRATGPLTKVFVPFSVDYQVPEQYLNDPPPEPSEPPETATASVGAQAGGDSQAMAAGAARMDQLWKRIWQRKQVSIGVLGALLFVITGIFFFQAWFARRPRVLMWTRYGVLGFVLVWLGWWSNAQLSVVNVFTLANSVLTGFSWTQFLMDPLVFILWAATAAAMIFWARGAFCGWLCPFGALQELTNRLARWAGVKQIAVPFGLHERLWPIKYLIFLGLFGLSLYDLALAERFAEVEPFKTAIILNFVRDWPYVIYALTLLSIGLFIERFFCRYLCPLGAALAIPARLRTFEWLKRWPDCGTQCHRCARECPVQAIHPEGHINVNECIYCLHCQELYFDDHRCPHNVTRRLKRERRRALGRRGSEQPTEAEAGASASSAEAADHKVSWGEPRVSKPQDPTKESE